MRKIKSINHFPVIALGTCIFSYLSIGFALISIALILNILISKIKFGFSLLDGFLSIYFLFAAYVYLSSNLDIRDFLSIVVFPIIIYLTTKSLNSDPNRIVLPLFILIMIYSVLMFFRDLNGEFSLSLTQNIYMNQRQVDDSLAVEANRLFKNATLVSIWLVTFFVLSLCLYNVKNSRLYLFFTIFSFVLVFLSNTRTALAISLIILSLNFILYKKGKTIIWLGLISIPIFYIIILSVGSIYSAQIDRFMQVIDSSSSYGLGQRTDLWSFASILIYSNPWGYGHIFFYEQTGLSIHQEYLGQALSIGVLGSIFYYLFIVANIIRNYRIIKSQRYESIIWNEISLYLLIVYLITGFTEQISLGNRYWVALLFAVLGWSRFKQKPMLEIINTKF